MECSLTSVLCRCTVLCCASGAIHVPVWAAVTQLENQGAVPDVEVPQPPRRHSVQPLGQQLCSITDVQLAQAVDRAVQMLERIPGGSHNRPPAILGCVDSTPLRLFHSLIYGAHPMHCSLNWASWLVVFVALAAAYTCLSSVSGVLPLARLTRSMMVTHAGGEWSRDQRKTPNLAQTNGHSVRAVSTAETAVGEGLVADGGVDV